MFNNLKHTLTAFLVIWALFFNILSAKADVPLKIKGLEFDNSDNIILIKSEGKISLDASSIKTQTSASQTTENKEGEKQNNAKDEMPEEIAYNKITKGFLKEPNRAYVDIANATLSGASKNYELKNSVFKNIRISQFSVNPNIVRLVFTYNTEYVNINNFNVMANNKAIIIRYSKPLSVHFNKTVKNQIIYSNTDDKNRVMFFENMTSHLVDNTVVPVNAESKNQDKGGELNLMFEKNNEKMTASDNYKLQSKFYISSINQTQNGIMIKGTGFLSLKPAFFLDNPNRMVIDFDDAVLNKNLRNKSFPIGEAALDSAGNIKQKETLRMGQNAASVVRLVIQGNEAKNYRVVISPDLQNVYIAKRSEVINTKITETESVIKSITTTKEGDKDNNTLINTVEFNLTNPAAFSTFEENNNLYLDFNNVTSMAPGVFDELAKHYENVQTVKLALDKLRIVFPTNKEIYNIQVKISPDAKTIQAVMKQNKTEENENDEGDKPKKEGLISKIINKEPSISNLYKVVIDAGHGGSDVGATRDGIYEKNITLSIAKMLEDNLNDKGVKTEMTLDKDKTVSLQERCDISNNFEPDLFVSVHVNSSVNDAIYGVETHWWKANSKEYADTVHSSLAKNFTKWKTKDRGLFKSQFYVINHTEAPAILVEIGFISNENERKLIITQKRQQEIAKAISEGIMNYLKNKGQKK